MKETEQKAIGSCSLFAGIDQPGLDRLLDCLGGEVQKFEKGAALFRQGQRISSCALVLSAWQKKRRP